MSVVGSMNYTEVYLMRECLKIFKNKKNVLMYNSPKATDKLYSTTFYSNAMQFCVLYKYVNYMMNSPLKRLHLHMVSIMFLFKPNPLNS